MSNVAINWAMAQSGLGVPEKFVLVTLANRARGNEAWPSISSITEDTALSERAVQRSISSLIKRGLIVAQRKGGRSMTGLYTLQMGATVAGYGEEERVPDRRETVPDSQERVPETTLKGDCVAPEPLREPKEPKEPKERTPLPPKVKKQAPPSLALAAALPPWLPLEAWNGFVLHREKIKKPMTDLAQDRMIRHLAQFRDRNFDIEAMLNTAIRRGWSDIYEPKAGEFAKPTPQAATNGYVSVYGPMTGTF